MRIAFHDNSLCLRGTTVAIYDWAYWTRHYLNIDPIIMFNLKNNFNDKSVIKKFEKEFPVFGYEDKSQIDDILSKNKCDAFLMEKGGEPDGIISSGSKNLVNAISGWWKPEWVHGDVYAMGSKWLSKITDYEIPYVPYIVHLPDHNLNMRDELGIPKDALVFGRNGGWDTFDLQFVKQSIVENLEKRNDIWFIFQYTEPFYEHERIIYLEPTADLNEKVKFINTSDVMLHARNIGESFGLSCAEFSIRNKPVITYYNSLERNHIDTLDEKGIFYENKEDIDYILLNLDRNEITGLEWNCYQDYSPENVVQKFKEVYL
jgi:hypothetical protein